MNDRDKEKYVKSIKRYLPGNWAQIIARKHKKNETYVRRVLREFLLHDSCFNDIIRLAEKGKAKQEDQLNRIEKLLPKPNPNKKRRRERTFDKD